MKTKSLDQGIVCDILPLHRGGEVLYSVAARQAATTSSMTWDTEGHILVGRPKRTRWTMIVVATSNEPAVDVAKKLKREWLVSGKGSNPLVGLDCCARLSLRTGYEFTGTLVHVQSCFKLQLCKVCPFNSRGSCNLQLKLDLLKFFHPIALVRNRRQGLHRSFSPNERLRYGHDVVFDPIGRLCVKNGHQGSLSFPFR